MLYYKKYESPEKREWVVFVHGAGGSSSIWFNQLRDFKKHFNVLMVDLRGHGKSKDLLQKYYEEDYSFEFISQDILDVLDHLEIDKAHFIGVSLGTIIIRTIAEIAPERVKSSILCGAITRLNVRSRILVFMGHMFKRFIPYMWLYKLFAWIIMPRKRHAKSRNLFIREAKKLYQKEFLRWFKMTNEVNPLLRYFKEKEVKSPMLYVMGSEDHMFLPPVRNIVEKHANSTLKVIESCGHVCNVERPNVFNRISIEYIKSHI
ncbi:MAG: 2-succinyl-6-hydroxy-2,4-cyclohexadiene-1-carboxylate synthase [Balneola sp.]|nr:2-succinyl-6-hydroxy-2,4-cyclohexadiene-1-carboxylate synthase [Balneola sp.]|tara:strand:- start:48037 stop:48819 length:783 start_codon:yes stop_codon:yes gene_type:complete